MTEPAPHYATAAPGDDARHLPTRAVNLARRMLELERLHARRGIVDIRIVMLDGQWFLSVAKPVAVEELGTG